MKYPDGYTCDIQIEVVREYGYFHVFGHVVDSAAARTGSTWLSRPEGLRDLVINSQGNDRGGLYGTDVVTDRYLYGIQVEYRKPYSLDLYQLEQRYKFLKGVQRKLDKLAATEGRHCDFATFCRRVARVIDAKHFVFKAESGEVPTRIPEGSRQGLVELSLEDGERRIRHIEEQWKAEVAPEVVR